ncbi:MAG: hypothetical protein M5U31_05105 [Acidimicrobiia bacterium]|nr:hypothetical protein [Acidimicrobiia bacterium]
MKKSFSTVVSYPPTWFAAVVVIVGVLMMIRFFEPPLLITLFLVAMGAALLLVWPLTMSATGTIDKLEFSKHDTSEEDRKEREELERQLRELGCEQGADQLRMLGTRLESLTEVLRERLNAGEMTYSRYLGTAHNVYSGSVDKLREVAISLRSVSNIDEDRLDSRLAELESGGDAGKRREEIATLENRRALRDRQTERVEKLLAQNETAITALDTTATALADAPIGREHASEDADVAVAELEALAVRASKYASR